MRKRRRLANKMTIMVCAVLLAVSAFFYAPMEVSAEESEIILNETDSLFLEDDYDVSALSSDDIVFDGSSASQMPNLHRGADVYFVKSLDLVAGLDSDTLYEVELSFTGSFNNTPSGYLRGLSFRYGDNSLFYSYYINVGAVSSTQIDFTKTLYLKGSDLYSKSLIFECIFLSEVGSSDSIVYYNFDSSLSVLSCVEVSNQDSDDYQNGYNDGYTAGESAGYSNGYSQGFADGEASIDTDAIYDEAYQAGVDSVDTQSYYDAGYQAGYQVAYSDGYDSGYDDGYQSAMDRIASWGADTSDYPVLEYSFFDDELRLICDVFTSAPSISYDSALLCYLDFDVNPNHTYKFVVRTGGTTGAGYDALYSDYKLNFVIGSNVINATNNVGETFDFFIPGYNMGSSILFEAYVYDCVYYGGVSEEDGFLKHMGQVYPTLKNCYIDIYDMGPSGDTQNHIANQTDQLTNGYDDSKGNTVNSNLSTGLNEYETAENSLFATATTGMRDFTFFDFESVPAMITGMSFIGSIMGSWFNQAGGASGVGIVLSILFSVILVAMVLGLYRWYQSRGGKN